MSVRLLMMAACQRWLDCRQQTEQHCDGVSPDSKMAANIPGMIFQFLRRPDSSESVLFASSGCWKLFEVDTRNSSKLSQLKALIHPDDRQAYEQSVAVSAATLQPWIWKAIVTPSGRLKWLQCASRPEQQPNGDILWDGLLMDGRY